ncbi:hypothetical protein ACWC10_37145 [Streptomyces sp. NPDC001595]|uniref:hypothetical protein n=1 Tax=Streptomyces sp. NPDC001532 TaxID=3154520 RepID=UPI00331FD9D7
MCAHAEDIRRRLRAGPPGSDSLLDDVLNASRGGDGDGGSVARAVNVLHSVLQALGDSQGLYSYVDHERSADRDFRAAGVDPYAGAGETVYLCPALRCTRRWWPQGAMPVPTCTISADVLRRDRL